MEIKFDDLPRAVDMELELLGSLLLKEGLIIPKIAAILQPDDFFSSVHKIIYQTILDLHKHGITPNSLLIYDELQKLKDFDANQKVFTDIVKLLDHVAWTTAYSENHARVIKEKSIRRQVILFANGLQRDAINPQIDFETFITTAESAFHSISDDIAPTSLIRHHDYFSNFLVHDIETNKLYANRQTGFSNIDEHQIFSPGLYVIGATPAAGKTTFCWQLLHQLAQNGETCIFCSYEMSALELYSKTLARELYLRDPQSTLTAADIRRGGQSPTLELLIAEIASDKNAKGTSVFELRDETIDDMLRLIRPYCTDKDKSPIVCLDYLQIVPSTKGEKFPTDKARIDDIVHKLKTFQRETNTTFIVVSSFNRMNYVQQVSFESFKESGNIEYTADVVWALQLDVVNSIKAGATISETRKKFENAKKQQPRKVQFKCLKNRQGMNYDCYFDYFSAHDFFKVSEKDEDDNSSEEDEDTRD